MMKLSDSTAPATAGCRFGSPRIAHTASTMTSTSATPLDARCANSTSVFAPAPTGMASPLHSGQLLPHPSPDSDART
jgi:hypothetical protein